VSAARIAARLRERLPEAAGWRVPDERPDCVDVRNRHGAIVGAVFPEERQWVRFASHAEGRKTGKASGPGWPERLAEALADALLGVSQTHICTLTVLGPAPKVRPS
jgi:hypothetical protein